MLSQVMIIVVIGSSAPLLVSTALLSQGKSIRASGQYSNWIAQRAIDGSSRTDADYCACCSATTNQYNPWYELDLGQSYTIRRIVVQGRGQGLTRFNQHFEGMRILLKSVDDGFEGPETTTLQKVIDVDYSLQTPKSSQYVSLVLYEITRIFTICELSVYGDCRAGEFGGTCQYRCFCEGNPCNEAGVCPSGRCKPGYTGQSCETECKSGRYGPGCTELCGSCTVTCDRWNGSCPGVCFPGFHGDLCKQECTNGTFGSGCTEKCGFCFDNQACEKVSGTCTGGCAAGYQYDRCQQECNAGTYGQDCKETCGSCFNETHCIHTNGTCSAGCEAGYEGHTCKTECMEGRYGPSCIFSCGSCMNGTICNKVSGMCESGCEPGYLRPYCKEKCGVGFYGDNCLSTCGYCKADNFCNHVNGTCDGGCAAGYMSGLCSEECVNGSHGEECVEACGQCLNGDPCNRFNGSCQGCEVDYEGHDCKTYIKQEDGSPAMAGAIGGAVGGVTAAVVVVIIVIFIVRRRKKKTSLGEPADNFTGINSAFEESIDKQETDSNDHKTIDEESKPLDVDEDTYYEFLVRKTDLKICQLWDYIYQKKKYDKVLFYQEFNLLVSGLQKPHDIAMLPKHIPKNRYRALCAYDDSRVPLIAEENGESEYINASYINGIIEPKKFIASQGPTKDMRIDFVRMVWQQKIKQIVMLTNLVEKRGEKCLIYWPEKDTEQFGNITLQMDYEDSTTDFVIRKLKIRQNEEPWRAVTQYHFTAWPDKAVPEGTWPLVKFWRMVMNDARENTVPILVHCSAGIGRTGTFIALDNAYTQAKTEGTIRMLDIVTSLREQRVNMVQTKDQYVFLHEAVADALLFGTHYIWSRDYYEVYKYLTQIDPETRKQRLRKQYQLIVESIEERKRIQNESNTPTDTVYSNIYIHNQTTEAVVTIDEYRPKSKKFDHFQELDAILLPSHDGTEAFIVTKSPTSTTRERYLSLIVEQNVKTAVILQGTMSAKDKKRVDLTEMVDLGTKYRLELIEEKNRDSFRQLKFRYVIKGDYATVCQFEYLAWKTKQPVPDEPRSILDFLEAILQWQQRLSGHHPLLVHGSNSFERSGMACVLLNELERMKRDEGHINIVETVKLMKERKENIIPNFEQYQFVHDAILKTVFTEEDSVYETPKI